MFNLPPLYQSSFPKFSDSAILSEFAALSANIVYQFPSWILFYLKTFTFFLKWDGVLYTFEVNRFRVSGSEYCRHIDILYCGRAMWQWHMPTKSSLLSIARTDRKR